MEKHFIYNNPFELSEFIATHETTKACKNYFGDRNTASNRTNDSDWYGTKDYNEADSLFKDGDIANSQKITETAINFEKKAQQRTQRRGMSPAVVGCLPNVPAALQGLPVSMFARNPQPAKPVVHLDINSGVDCSIEGETVIKVGAVILSVVNQLEKSGHSVEITIKCCTRYKKDTIKTDVTIKKAGQRFNASQLAYCLVNPSFLRRHLFAVWERTEKNKDFFNGYGRVGSSCESTCLSLQEICDKLQRHIITDDEITDRIKSVLY